MLRRVTLTIGMLWVGAATAAAPLPLRSAHAIVVDEATGEVLLQKDGVEPAPMASLTKLMTAMVVLDAQQDDDEPLRIAAADREHVKRTRGGLPVGAVASRGNLLELMLAASDNPAASALARSYPGGPAGFQDAMQSKIVGLGLAHTRIEEPTGLSPNNVSSAQDMVKVLRAAASYPAIARITSRPSQFVQVDGRLRAVHNTNPLVGAPGWNILLSKTGYTNEAGRCLTMRLEAAGRTVVVVLMGAVGSAERALDALKIRQWLGNEEVRVPLAVPVRSARSRAHGAGARRRDGALEPRPGFFDATPPSETARESDGGETPHAAE
jgi:D-alanyl-D-alanine endopeptidase (penicillin-binding protein 7)